MTRFCFLFFLFINSLTYSQSGMWIWMNGDSIPGSPGNFGTLGVPSPSNHPPGLYETCEWTDLQGNFWLYGGLYLFGAFNYENAMWKFEPATNIWTWMWGSSTPGQSPVWGVKGVASPANSPGGTYFGSSTFTDNAGNLWLFGGDHPSTSRSNALWKYDIGTNMWTWMSGDNTINPVGNYGTQGIPSVNNAPASREECVSAWFENNNFWIFGGTNYAIQSMNDLWKYNVLTNEWTWMKGDSTSFAPSSYGVKGVSNSSNDPGSRYCYSHWKDLNNNLWFFGGSKNLSSSGYSDMWKYDTGLNEWTWMSGSNLPDDSGVYGGYCVFDSLSYPSTRTENKTCWTDACGMFWLMGGRFTYDFLEDLWQYNPIINEWKLVSGNSSFNSFGNYGTMGVPSASNKCPARNGSSPWMDNNGNLWLYGGYTKILQYSASDMWMYIPDASCTSCNVLQASFNVSDPSLCPGSCASFTNSSLNGISYQWFFPGANPDTSTLQNPFNICYNLPGTYDVTLIASDGNTSDTLFLPSYILVHPFPAPQSILQSGDTLFALQNSVSYQWYFNGNVISGETNYFCIANSDGNYNVVATDSNGCEVEAVIFDVDVGFSPITFAEGSEVRLVPNPAGDQLFIFYNGSSFHTASIYNMTGERVTGFQKVNPVTEVDVHILSHGVYFLELSGNQGIHRIRFIKK